MDSEPAVYSAAPDIILSTRLIPTEYAGMSYLDSIPNAAFGKPQDCAFI